MVPYREVCASLLQSEEQGECAGNAGTCGGLQLPNIPIGPIGSVTLELNGIGISTGGQLEGQTREATEKQVLLLDGEAGTLGHVNGMKGHFWLSGGISFNFGLQAGMPSFSL